MVLNMHTKSCKYPVGSTIVDPDQNSGAFSLGSAGL